MIFGIEKTSGVVEDMARGIRRSSPKPLYTTKDDVLAMRYGAGMLGTGVGGIGGGLAGLLGHYLVADEDKRNWRRYLASGLLGGALGAGAGGLGLGYMGGELGEELRKHNPWQARLIEAIR